MSAKTPEPKLDLDRTRDALLRLGLEQAAGRIAEVLSRAVKEEIAPHRVLDDLLSAEIAQREERRIRTSLRLSAMPPGLSLSNFDWSFQPDIDRRRVETLATCSWIREHETVLLQGPPGVGKTHLAVALGVRAVECGFSVGFYHLDDLMHELKRDAEVAPTRLKGKKYLRSAMLIIDEVGFRALTRLEASLFFRLVSVRYQRSATVITTNKAVKEWPEVFAGDEVMVTALLDRLLHRCHVFNIKGRSYRLRDLERASSG
ncbi:MAG: IS21-like element helper ATPase IstB [Planctomycetes bacterium]|nr:IS21-like element helper ATPase IstB [Planctomycetota bacterium]